MKFYKDIASLYHRLFPRNMDKINFLAKTAKGKNLLDVACGDGGDLLALKEKGLNPRGIDLSREMVIKAREKGTNAYMANMVNYSDDRTYDMIFCVGNSICHLEDKKEIQQAFQEAYDHLIDNGNYVVQFINYHPFLKSEDDFLGELPLITDDELVFKRQYFRNNDHIRFHTEIQGDFDPIINDVQLYPLLEEEAREWLEKVGFQNIKSYSGFSHKKYQEDAYAVVMTAEK